MKIEFPYGRERRVIDVPVHSNIIATPALPISHSPLEQIHKAISEPIGVPSISDVIPPNSKVLIIVSDHTRPVPNASVLTVLKPFLEQTFPEILIGTGLHSPPTSNQIEEILGSFATGPYPIHVHSATTSPLESYGRTSNGTLVEINALGKAFDKIIVIGRVAPHFFAGFSGGPKAILPGIAGVTTILQNHSYAQISNQNASIGELLANPVHMDMREAATRVGVDFNVNLILTPSHQLSQVFAGDLFASHSQSCQWLKSHIGVPITHKAKTTLVSNGGYPYDHNFYQSVKGLYIASQFTELHGHIILLSRCINGIGHEHFYDLATSNSPMKILKKLQVVSKPIIDQWQVQILMEVLSKHTVHVLSDGLKAEDITLMNMHPITSIDQVLIDQNLMDQSINVIPDGPELLPLPIQP